MAYRLDPETVTGDPVDDRNYKRDPWLEYDETLNPADYAGFWPDLASHRGHQAPLATFRGTDLYTDTNYLSNITPQKSALNNGAWKALEGRIRIFVEAGNAVYVMTGTLYDGDTPMAPLPNHDDHTVPTGYWKIVFFQDGNAYESIKAASFIFEQGTRSGVDPLDYLVTIDEVQRRSGLNFLGELSANAQATIEGNDFAEWASENFQ